MTIKDFWNLTKLIIIFPLVVIAQVVSWAILPIQAIILIVVADSPREWWENVKYCAYDSIDAYISDWDELDPFHKRKE